ncbi:MAG: hypothetical protein JST30_07975 [Armatimonadetes bacterium]|nr:hypothetical protein [Armatimonadota bacterium]
MFLLVLSLVRPDPESARAEVLTSTRWVKAVASKPDGSFAVATSGGLLRRGPDGRWTKATVADGLPDNELEDVSYVQGRTVVLSRGTWYVESEGAWAVSPRPKGLPSEKKPVQADRSSGLTVEGRPFAPPLPPEAGAPTSTAAAKGTRLVGTAGSGLYELKGKAWSRVPFDEPPGNSVQALTFFQGHVVVSTLQEGLSFLTTQGWSPQDPGSKSPREAAVFRSALYVRQADGTVDRLQDGTWSRDVLTPSLPRKQARSIVSAPDGSRLFVAQWAGWSSWSGDTWDHRLQDSELSGCATTCLLPTGRGVWLGTQGRCAALVEGQSVRWVDERHGFPDDWVTCLARVGESVYAGTFVGGLVRVDSASAVTVGGTLGENVTCIGSVDGQVVFGSRTGLYRVTGHKAERITTPFPIREVQALAVGPDAVWIGTRTGLARIPLSRFGR